MPNVMGLFFCEECETLHVGRKELEVWKVEPSTRRLHVRVNFGNTARVAHPYFLVTEVPLFC